MGKMTNVVTSALVLTGVTTLASMHAEASELDSSGWSEEDIQSFELEAIEKALRSYTNPLQRIQAEISHKDHKQEQLYVVRQGDTLTDIAEQWGVSVTALSEWNHIDNENYIHAGQRLRIPVQHQVYIVKHGDTLGGIASSQGISEEELLSSNVTLQKSSIALFPGQQIVIPHPQSSAETIISHSPTKRNKLHIASTQMSASLSAEQQYSSSSLEGFIWPVEGKLSSTFGMRWGRPHTGIDITHPERTRTPIMAAKGGVVREVSYHRGGYGQLVIIDHGDKLETYYAHLSSVSVQEGQYIEQGKVMGYMGSSGNATGVHLHFEIRKDDRPLNPISYLPKQDH